MNRDTAAARRYHDRTKHSVASLQAHPHYLDWDIKPLAFKVYPHIEPIQLPRELPPSSAPALEVIGRTEITAGDAPRVPDLTELARVLHFSAGVIRKKVYAGGQEHYFRAAACTGALYHIDVYLVCADLPGLAAGVYHFGPHNFSLYRLRPGDHREVLAEATGNESVMQHAPVILACASTYWRNAWKYQSRAYRHCFWDSGTILANLLAVAAADELPVRVLCGFVDATVSTLLGLDAEGEAPLALVAIGNDPRPPAEPPPSLPDLTLDTLPLSSREVDYPAIREMQSASSLRTPEEARAWRDGDPPPITSVAPSGKMFALRPLDAAASPAEPIDSVIQRRGSTREFARVPMGFAQLSTIIERSTRGIAADFGGSSSDVYLIVNAVEGLASGSYVYHPDRTVLELLRAGDFRREAGHLGLGQELPADASVNLYLLCSLAPVLARFGNRGYRAAQLDAAIVGGKMYLAAYALRLGATGLTFFDDEVIEFFSPHAAGKSVMFLVAIGRGKKMLRQAR